MIYPPPVPSLRKIIHFLKLFQYFSQFQSPITVTQMVGAQTIKLLWQHFRGAVRREYISAVDTTWSVVDTQCQLGAGGKPATKQRGGSFLLTTLIIGGGITLIIRRAS